MSAVAASSKALCVRVCVQESPPSSERSKIENSMNTKEDFTVTTANDVTHTTEVSPRSVAGLAHSLGSDQRPLPSVH